MLTSPEHFTFLGSGSHSPFSIHSAILDPKSTCPGGQLKVTLAPSGTGNAFWLITVIASLILSAGFPQLAYATYTRMKLINDTSLTHDKLSHKDGTFSFVIKINVPTPWVFPLRSKVYCSGCNHL